LARAGSGTVQLSSSSATLGDEITLKPGGRIETRAQFVLAEAVELLKRIAARGLMESIEGKIFADVSRTPNGGRGFDGVFEKAPDYWNPFADELAGTVAR